MSNLFSGILICLGLTVFEISGFIFEYYKQYDNAAVMFVYCFGFGIGFIFIFISQHYSRFFSKRS